MGKPEIPSDDNLEKMLAAMDVTLRGHLLDPEDVKKLESSEAVGRIALLDALRDLVQEKGEAAKLAGFVFVGVSDDGVTPVLYSVQTMEATTARLLIAEITLLLQRLTQSLNDIEDYVPQDLED